MKLNIKNGKIDMSHGSGGRASALLIEELFLKYLNNDWLAQRNDSATFNIDAGRMVMSTDAHVISPLFFPGGDIGSLAVYGSVNDVAMSGAKPLYLSVSFILEEGFALCDLECIVISMAQAAKDCAVNIVCGDTKVVERGKGDGVFISTTGVGVLPQDVNICGSKAQVGDIIILSGSIGDHGVAILSKRENLQFETTIESDSAALNHLVADMVNAVPQIHCLRDPTRGGLATTLNEIATQSAVGMHIHETAIPVKAEVAAACELLGLDPLYMANEGKLIAICARADAETLLCVMRDHPLAKHSSIIGEIVADKHRLVQMHTAFGGQRIVDYLNADPLPRIC